MNIPTLSKESETWSFTLPIIVLSILVVFFIPVSPFLIDVGLTISFSASVWILLVALSISRPLEFTSFPALLLLVTLMRLALNIATTRAILSGNTDKEEAAGQIISAMSRLAMGGDLVVGIIVFSILTLVNFVVITKGASRIAEVGARFTLDAIPGKQMSIDADLSTGSIDEKEAQRRRRELEEESMFFGAMDGASKFVRGDAVAGLIILAVNMIGGILVGVFRAGLSLEASVDLYVKLSIGDGLVTQIPSLIVSLGAGIIVSKGSGRESMQATIVAQVTRYKGLMYTLGGLLVAIACLPHVPFLPFSLLGCSVIGYALYIGSEIPRDIELERPPKLNELTDEVSRSKGGADLELAMGRYLCALLAADGAVFDLRLQRLMTRVQSISGVLTGPIVRIEDSSLSPHEYEIRIAGSVAARFVVKPSSVLVLFEDSERPSYPGETIADPVYRMQAMWVPEHLKADVALGNNKTIDRQSLVLAHLEATARRSLDQVYTYQQFKRSIDQLPPEYKSLVEELCPSQISMTGIHGIFRSLLSEQVTIQPCARILEGLAEALSLSRRADRIVEHVRLRVASYIVTPYLSEGKLKTVWINPGWEEKFQRGIRRDERNEIVEFQVDLAELTEFQRMAIVRLREILSRDSGFVVVTNSDLRSYIKALLEKDVPDLCVLSKLEVLRAPETVAIGVIP